MGFCIRLAPIESISPSLSETMRMCLLRGGLSRSRDLSTFILGNPKAWLGNAYHEVLEILSRTHLPEDVFLSNLNVYWHDAVKKQHDRMKRHPLDQRFGNPPTWPGYNLVLASLRARAQNLREEYLMHGEHSVEHKAVEGVLFEREFRSFAGRLVGRPDVVIGKEIRDYKTGGVFETSDDLPDCEVKESYARQLYIYGYLVKEVFGVWPERGVLLPMSGGRAEIMLDPDSCTREAEEAVALLDTYNTAIHTKSAEHLASASVDSCKWCQFKILCPAFWNTANASWSGMLDGDAVECNIVEEPRRIHGGEAFSVSMGILRGSQAPRQIDLTPLSSSTHQFLATVGKDDRVRIMGLRVRTDGILIPTIRTLGAKIDDLPVLA